MMKKISLLFLLAVFTCSYSVKAQTEAQKVEICSGMAGADATYLKDFQVQLDAAHGNEKPPQANYSMVLQKDTKYRLTICTSDDSPGKGFLQLWDGDRLYGATYDPKTGREFKGFDFDCQKTGIYHVFIMFVDGKAGNAIGILSFVKKL
jgi:hypothetical protein